MNPVGISKATSYTLQLELLLLSDYGIQQGKKQTIFQQKYC